MIEIENKKGNVLFKGNKEQAIKFLNNKNYNIDYNCPLMILGYLVRDSFNLYIR